MADVDFWSEHYIKRGDPKKPTYYIMRRMWIDPGLFSDFNLFAGHIRYALSNGWLPVADMQNYANPYLAPEKLGKENSWEYYFEQPLRIGLEEAYSGENVILSVGNESIPYPSGNTAFFENRNGILTEWRMLVKMGLLKIKDNIMEEILAIREKLFSPNERILGVHLRGTDYLALRPHGHSIQPPVEFAASIVIQKIQEWQCDKIFLATEDKSILEVFKQVFGDFCITLDREYVDYVVEKIAITNSRIERENDRFLQGKEYLIEMILLSMCNSFVTSRCNGAISVMMMAEHFENVYAFNLGKYGVIGLD